jgi:hypothetical protein
MIRPFLKMTGFQKKNRVLKQELVQSSNVKKMVSSDICNDNEKKGVVTRGLHTIVTTLNEGSPSRLDLGLFPVFGRLKLLHQEEKDDEGFLFNL